jgi:signal peptidase I
VRSRWGGCLIEIVETLLLTLVIFWVLQSFVAQPYQILQVSMEQTLEPNQYVLVDKLSPHWSDYKRGEVIVFEPPAGYEEEGQNIPFIKRVVGVAGDLVEVKNDSVWVNGVRLDEPYVYKGQATTPITTKSSWLVPDGQLFVLGDHRQASVDSRVFGPIPKSTVVGRAWLRYWPFDSLSWVEAAHYEGVPDSPPPGTTEPPATTPTAKP